MDLSTLREQAERCRRLAKHADPSTQKRLLDLASESEGQIAKLEPGPSAHPAFCGLASNDRRARRAPFSLQVHKSRLEINSLRRQVYPFRSQDRSPVKADFHFRDFDDFTLGVIGRPFADLFTILKVSRTHFGAVPSEP